MDTKNTKSSVFAKKIAAGKIELTKEDVIRILGHIDEELGKEGLKATAMIYGGCALMLHGYDTRSTTDIDYVVTGVPMADYSRVVDRVVARSNPPFHRSLFDITMGPLLYAHFLKNEMDEMRVYKNLKIMVATPKQLLAMKLFSARLGEGFHDLQDSICLAREVGLKDFLQLKTLLLAYVKQESVDRANKNPEDPGYIDSFIKEVEKGLV